jgi:hypothetical protein
LILLLPTVFAIHRRRRYLRSLSVQEHRERRERRISRHQERRQTIRALFRRFVLGIDMDDEEKAAMLAEQRRRHRQRRSGTDSDSDAGPSMEEDLASFREAASVVSDMVAAEEGRLASVQARRQTETTVAQLNLNGTGTPRVAPPPLSPGAAFPYDVPMDEVLPAYEEAEAMSVPSESVVSDGFRSSPGSAAYTPSETSSASDVLGETKN